MSQLIKRASSSLCRVPGDLPDQPTGLVIGSLRCGVGQVLLGHIIFRLLPDGEIPVIPYRFRELFHIVRKDRSDVEPQLRRILGDNGQPVGEMFPAKLSGIDKILIIRLWIGLQKLRVPVQ
ncbi:hypothetical protein D3C74_356750 [compost metagenome]